MMKHIEQYEKLYHGEARCAIRPNAVLPYRREPMFPKVSIPPVPADARAADKPSGARAEMGVRGGSEDACDDTDALDAGRPCTRAGVDELLRAAEVNCGSCGVGTGDGVAGWLKGLFIAKGLFELQTGRSERMSNRDTVGLPKRRLLRHEGRLLGCLQLGLILGSLEL